MLTRPAEQGGITISQTITVVRAATEEEATGYAVTYALKEKPGFGIDLITAGVLEDSGKFR